MGRVNSRLWASGAPFFLLVCASTLVGASLFNSAGAPSRRTGAPGDLTCADSGCHVGNAVNTGSGSVSILGAGEYVVGMPLDLIVHAQREGAGAFGFSITVRDASNNMVGAWEIVSGSGTQISPGEFDPTHVTHDQAAPVSDEFQWNLRWIPPASDAGPVTFYAAANTANGTGTQFGDFIYTTSHSATFAGTTDSETLGLPARIRIDSIFPNPARESVTFDFDIVQSGIVQLHLFDMDGRLVSTLSRTLAAGKNRVSIATQNLASGVYAYRLISSGHSESGTLSVSR